MQRRSARLPKHTVKSLADLKSDEGDLDSKTSEDEAPVAKKQPGRKRKNNNEKGEGQPPSKKLRGKRGILKQLVEMPLDILFEIFGQLEPIDLLHLAWTTKELRSMLMSRSSISIWKESRSNIAGLPECPGDLSEPQYANFLFGKGCNLCQRHLGNMHYVWSARLRACTKCIEDRFYEKTEYWELFRRAYPRNLLVFIPSITMSKRSGRYNKGKDLYDSVVDACWEAEYENAADKEKWLKEKLEEVIVIQEHANACEIWHMESVQIREREKATVMEDRRDLVVRRIKKLGWEDEFSSMRKWELLEDPLVIKLCRKEVTERALDEIQDSLIALMEQAKRARLKKERRNTLVQRLQMLKRIVQTYVTTLPPNSIFPTTGELFRNPIVRNIINNAPSSIIFTEKHFDDIVPMLPELALQWRKETEEKLVVLAMNAAPETTLDRKKVLQLATTVFTCSNCTPGPMRIPRVLMHSCATMYEHPREVDKADYQILKAALRETFWNSVGHIKCMPEDHSLMSRVVELCGFDPKTTTAVEMDAANPIIECVSCNDVHEGRATMTWSKVYFHHRLRHVSLNRPISHMELELLDEQNANIARAQMFEKLERKKAEHRSHLICVHCKQTGNMPNLVKHVKKDHGKPRPTNEDIVPPLDSDMYTVPPLLHLWPPREPVDDVPMNAEK